MAPKATTTENNGEATASGLSAREVQLAVLALKSLPASSKTSILNYKLGSRNRMPVEYLILMRSRYLSIEIMLRGKLSISRYR